ncbi:MAG: hypothetical protein AAGA64_15480 [Bacteroidota bacterium]
MRKPIFSLNETAIGTSSAAPKKTVMIRPFELVSGRFRKVTFFGKSVTETYGIVNKKCAILDNSVYRHQHYLRFNVPVF